LRRAFLYDKGRVNPGLCRFKLSLENRKGTIQKCNYHFFPVLPNFDYQELVKK
jgi:hypothetical protein